MLTQISPLRYEVNGGSIIDFSLSDKDGHKVNLITSGFVGEVKLAVKFDTPFQDVAFGFHLKSVSGLEVAGLSYPNPADALVVVDKGDIIEVSWSINMMLVSGIYFFTFGVRSVSSDGFIDRVVDAMAVKVIKNASSSAFGIFDISKGSGSLSKGNEL